jgi:UDP-3-O-acyl-N-acetylglucosamine deacetylase
MKHRRTIARAARIPASGDSPGLFTGAANAVDVLPAEPGSGVSVQIVADGHPHPLFPATIDHLDPREPSPVLRAMGSRHTRLAADADAPAVWTVEHLLGALVGLGITDALVRVTCRAEAEIPIFDGSAKPFTDAIETADGPAIDWAMLPSAVEVRSGDSVVRAEPCDPGDASYTYALSYDHPFLGDQTAAWNANDDEAFRDTVAPARTFSLEAEARAAQAAGLFTGFSPADLLVIADDGPIDNEMRFANEPAAHKLLDLIGDLALASNAVGAPIAMRVTATRSGHALHHDAARALVHAIRGI